MIIFIFSALTEDDERTIKSIFSNQNVKMYNISFKILRSESDAQEAVQEAFLKIIKNIEKINKLPCHEKVAYCVVILKNVSFDMLKEKKRQISFDKIDDYVQDDFTNTEDDFFDFENKKILGNIINKLSTSEKQLLQLRYANELNHKEIGKLFNISEETSRKPLERIIKKLRFIYKERENYEEFI